jgi:hypothetical protein
MKVDCSIFAEIAYKAMGNLLILAPQSRIQATALDTLKLERPDKLSLKDTVADTPPTGGAHLFLGM